jgi:pimeloyl-ACP methyl ester carboxylesterase/tetratricopeptide (TPR) repeat protein
MKATARCWIFPLVLALSVAALVLGVTATKVSTRERDGSLAPELSGLGTVHMAVRTDVPKAQAFFDQGLRLLYAFNHEEARRAFREAARLDPSLSMAHWGIAMTLAPNLNAPMTPEQGRSAFDAIQQARRTARLASGRERTLIDALATRFAVDPASPRPPLDRAYAAAMARLAEAYPDDPNVATLYADAVMNTMPWDYWQKDGSPKSETAVVSRVLERAIAANPDHAGAHHYYVHLLEASDTPERAEASADRLGALMPAAGHMVHMPAHIYLRVGRYADAAEANVRAIAADEDYLAQCQAQGLYPVSYYPHNLHFLWAAATLEGRSAVAIDAARQVAAKVPHHHAGALAWTADFPVTPWLAYARFGRWQDMLTEPRPPASEPYATGIWHYARGLAFIARRQTARAEGELVALTALLDHEAFRTTLKDSPLLINLQIASRLVRGELAARAHRFDEAIQIVSEAVALEDGIPYNEPPVWHQPTRQVLGALLLEAGRAKEAEAAYRQDLKRFRDNGWSLFGLWQSLQADDRSEEAQDVRARFAKAWARADVTLTSSRILDEAQGGDGTSADRVKEGVVVKSIALPTGVTLQYVEQGNASGVPIVFLHGVTDSWRSFDPLLEHLPPDVHALAVTARGHGHSSKPPEGYRYGDMSEDLRAFMDALELPTAVIVGHSMGSMVAQRFAIDHPSRLAGLVLMGSFKTLHRHAALQEFWDTALSTLADPIAPGLARDFQVSTLAREIPAEFLDVMVNESLTVPARVWRELFKGFLETPDFSREVGSVTAPTLIAWGEKDSYALRADQEALRSTIAGSRLIIYPGAGHAFHWEDPRRFAADLVAFVYERR